MTPDLCRPQGRGGGRAPGEDAGAEQRQDGQERREVCPSVTVRKKPCHPDVQLLDSRLRQRLTELILFQCSVFM